MHDCSIMHRDLTPRNCLLCHHAGKNMQLKISDFGASCFLAPNNSQKEAWPLQGPRVHSQSLALSRTTYNYAAPEVINHQAYSFPADVWSTGIILWQMLQEDARIAAVSFGDKPTQADLQRGIQNFIEQIKILSQEKQAERPPLFTLACNMLQLPAELIKNSSE